MAQINDVTDYLIVRLNEAGVGLNVLKLHKLLYYVQGWHLAAKGTPLFPGRFQAWVHGPVSRQVYDRFSSTHTMYSLLGERDVRPGFDQAALAAAERAHIDEVVDAYAQYSGTQLEEMTHSEAPWRVARGTRGPAERCETELDEAVMRDFFRAELAEGA